MNMLLLYFADSAVDTLMCFVNHVVKQKELTFTDWHL